MNVTLRSSPLEVLRCSKKNDTVHWKKPVSEPFNKVAGSRPVNISKKTLVQVFSSEFCKIFNSIFF